MDAKEERRKRDRERYAQMTDEKKQEKLKKRREAYQQKKMEICANQRQIYANMQPGQKKCRIEQIIESKRKAETKDSIAMENPAYIATEQEVSTSTFDLNHRKNVTPGKRQALLRRRNKDFMTRRKKIIPESSQEEASMMETDNDDTKTPEQSEGMSSGNTLNSIQYMQS